MPTNFMSEGLTPIAESWDSSVLARVQWMSVAGLFAGYHPSGIAATASEMPVSQRKYSFA